MIDGFSGREIAKLAVAWQVCWILLVLIYVVTRCVFCGIVGQVQI